MSTAGAFLDRVVAGVDRFVFFLLEREGTMLCRALLGMALPLRRLLLVGWICGAIYVLTGAVEGLREYGFGSHDFEAILALIALIYGLRLCRVLWHLPRFEVVVRAPDAGVPFGGGFGVELHMKGAYEGPDHRLLVRLVNKTYRVSNFRADNGGDSWERHNEKTQVVDTRDWQVTQLPSFMPAPQSGLRFVIPEEARERWKLSEEREHFKPDWRIEVRSPRAGGALLLDWTEVKIDTDSVWPDNAEPRPALSAS